MKQRKLTDFDKRVTERIGIARKACLRKFEHGTKSYKRCILEGVKWAVKKAVSEEK